MKTITIIGGGLGGLALGVYLRRLSVPVRLIEAGSYPKHKVCGEFICGVDPAWLTEMGLGNIISDSLHHTDMKWWVEGRQVLSAELPRTAWGLSRYKLDLDLASTFEREGGELLTGERAAPRDFSEEGTVQAIGKKPREGSDWIGLKVHAKNVSVQGLEMHVGQSGYVGLCEVENSAVNVCGLFKVRRGLRGKDLIRQYLHANGLDELAQRLEQGSLVDESFSATAGFQLGKQPSKKGVQLGDSSYLIPPFTGNGMSMALESAYLAGGLLKQYSQGELGWDEVATLHKKRLDQHFRKRMNLAGLLHPLFFSKMGRRALSLTAPILPYRSLFTHLRTR